MRAPRYERGDYAVCNGEVVKIINFDPRATTTGYEYIVRGVSGTYAATERELEPIESN
jgi:hypothetical protein